MTKGVNVTAAAAGTVRAIRDGMPDQPISAQNCASIAGKECGNAVAVQHRGGWETRYCHLKKIQSVKNQVMWCNRPIF